MTDAQKHLWNVTIYGAKTTRLHRRGVVAADEFEAARIVRDDLPQHDQTGLRIVVTKAAGRKES